jgi:hypothetical protein
MLAIAMDDHLELGQLPALFTALVRARKVIHARPAAARAVSLSALTGGGDQMIIASSSISAIPITSTAIATGS